MGKSTINGHVQPPFVSFPEAIPMKRLTPKEPRSGAGAGLRALQGGAGEEKHKDLEKTPGSWEI